MKSNFIINQPLASHLPTIKLDVDEVVGNLVYWSVYKLSDGRWFYVGGMATPVKFTKAKIQDEVYKYLGY